MFKRCVLMAMSTAMFVFAGTVHAATDEALANMDGDVIARIHFAGTTKVASSNSKLRELAALSETALLREQMLQQLATTPFRLFKSKLANGNTNDYAALLRPMMDDLLSEESYLEIRGAASAMPETLVAVRLNNNRAQLWRDGLSMVLSTWTGIPVRQIQSDGFSGWELRKHHDPNVIRFLRAGDWVLFGWGQDELRLQPGFLHRIKAQRSPVAPFKDNWLDAMIDWPTFMKYHPFTPPGILPNPLPKMHLTVESRKDYVRPKLVVQFPQALNLNLEPWKIPTNLIHNPLASFTAVRGIAPWLARQDFIRQMRLPSIPNQATFWSVPKIPFHSDVAVPMPNASNYMAQTAPRIVPDLSSYLMQHMLPNKLFWTNNNLFLRGFPMIMPRMGSLHDTSGDYLVGGLAPVPARKNASPFPSDLMREIIPKANLVAYSWEINQERIGQWITMHQLDSITQRKGLSSSTSTGMKWLTAAKVKLGNCATETSLTAPNELTILRNAPIGLSSMDMVVLEYWLDAPGFPLDENYPRTTLGNLKKRTGAPVSHRAN